MVSYSRARNRVGANSSRSSGAASVTLSERVSLVVAYSASDISHDAGLFVDAGEPFVD